MSYDLKIELSPEARELLGEYPLRKATAVHAMAHALDEQNELTIGHAQRTKLSGPRPDFLGVRTNRLRGSLRRSEAVIGDGYNSIEGSIGSNVVYAGVHEYGFDGDVTVSAHSYIRRNRGGDVFTRGPKGGKKLSAAGISYVNVKSFTRHMHMPERSFIRSSIAERLEEYNDALSGAIVDALGGPQ